MAGYSYAKAPAPRNAARRPELSGATGARPVEALRERQGRETRRDRSIMPQGLLKLERGHIRCSRDSNMFERHRAIMRGTRSLDRDAFTSHRIVWPVVRCNAPLHAALAEREAIKQPEMREPEITGQPFEHNQQALWRYVGAARLDG